MSFRTLPLAPPQPKRVVLENGLVLFLLRNPEVPLVTVQALVRTGAVLEPADKVDLAELTGRAMRTGGTANFTGPELSRRLESLGASLETGIGRQSGTATLSVLSPDLPVGIELLRTCCGARPSRRRRSSACAAAGSRRSAAATTSRTRSPVVFFGFALRLAWKFLQTYR